MGGVETKWSFVADGRKLRVEYANGLAALLYDIEQRDANTLVLIQSGSQSMLLRRVGSVLPDAKSTVPAPCPEGWYETKVGDIPACTPPAGTPGLREANETRDVINAELQKNKTLTPCDGSNFDRAPLGNFVAVRACLARRGKRTLG